MYSLEVTFGYPSFPVCWWVFKKSNLHDYVISAFFMFPLRLSFHQHLTPVDHLWPSLETNRSETADDISFHQSQLMCLCSERRGNSQNKLLAAGNPTGSVDVLAVSFQQLEVMLNLCLVTHHSLGNPECAISTTTEFPRFPPQTCFVAPFSVIDFFKWSAGRCVPQWSLICCDQQPEETSAELTGMTRNNSGEITLRIQLKCSRFAALNGSFLSRSLP